MRRTLRAAPTLLRVGFSEAVAYRAEFLVWLLSTNMPLVMLALWSAVARDGPVGRFTQADFAAYYLAALVVRLMTGAWVVWELNFEIRQGTLAFRMLRPVHPLVAYAAENVAAMPVRLAVSLPVALVALWILGGKHVTHDPLLLALFPVTVFSAWLITYLAMAAVGCLAFWLESATSLFDVWLGLFGIFSGYLVPLELYPRWVNDVSWFLPFRYMLAFPVELVTGGLTRSAGAGPAGRAAGLRAAPARGGRRDVAAGNAALRGVRGIGGPMLRYLRLLAVQFRASLQTSMQYRVDFLVQGAMAFFWMAWAVVPLLVVFGTRDRVAGWDFDQALVVHGLVPGHEGGAGGGGEPVAGQRGRAHPQGDARPGAAQAGRRPVPGVDRQVRALARGGRGGRGRRHRLGLLAAGDGPGPARGRGGAAPHRLRPSPSSTRCGSWWCRRPSSW